MMSALDEIIKEHAKPDPRRGYEKRAAATAELAQLRAAAAEAQSAHVYLDESPVNNHDDPPLEIADRAARLVNEILQLRADLQAAQERIAAQAAIIREQEQDIENVTAREAAVIENHRRANAEQAQQLDEARNVIRAYRQGLPTGPKGYTSRPLLDLHNAAEEWLAAHPAMHAAMQRREQ